MPYSRQENASALLVSQPGAPHGYGSCGICMMPAKCPSLKMVHLLDRWLSGTHGCGLRESLYLWG